MKIIDLTGKKIGRLTVINFAGSGKDKRANWNCQCECGNQKIIHGNRLRTGNTKSCGCLKGESLIQRSTTHGFAHHPLYMVWSKIKDRCLNNSAKDYKHYGGRGITICNEWLNPETFITWALANGWQKGLEIDRRENNGNYEPGNCRFVTHTENLLNRRKWTKAIH